MRTLALLLLLVGSVSAAQPRMPAVGTRFPYTEGMNLAEQPVSIDALLDGPTLLIVLTDRHGAEEVEAWFAEAERRLSPRVERVSVVSLRLPFVVSRGMAADRARASAPEDEWEETLLDVRGDMADDLGLAPSRLPYVFALDESGHVIARVHGTVDDPSAETIWFVLGADDSAPAVGR